ncbi:Tetratricopeptide repeat-containing protein [Pseudoalteromonas denitrificans DSM 6059]|uniref:histidine kinase n=1 Tax=Pseudoalteromonas denitrificans DSM 6059 TaxID=1123010 RepID=A0A1I1S3T2_9GAMM|nr:Tetratricopeptide repeat-containing protein [Pseudoalteromonas denitrificans DSM 6059]
MQKHNFALSISKVSNSLQLIFCIIFYSFMLCSFSALSNTKQSIYKVDEIEALLTSNPNQALSLSQSVLKSLPSKLTKETKESHFQLSLIEIKAYLKLGKLATAFNLADSLVESVRVQKNLSWLGKSYQILGFISQAQNKIKMSTNYFQQAKLVFEKNNEQQALSSLYLQLSRNYRYQAQYSQALSLLQEAQTIAKSFNNISEQADIHNALGVLYDYMGSYELALIQHEQSLVLQRQILNEQGIASSLYNIGEIYRKIDNLPLALKYFKQALKVDEQLGDPRHIANSNGKLSQVYLQMNDLLRAREYAQIGLNIAKSSKAEGEISWNQSNLAKVLIAQGDFEEAEKLLKDALLLAIASKAKRTENMLRITLVELAVQRENYEHAIPLIKAALSASDMDLRYRAQLYELQSQAFEALKQYQNALSSYQAFNVQDKAIRDKLNNQHVERLMQNIEFIRKDQEVESLKKDQALKQASLKQLKLEIMLILLGFTLLLVVIGAVFWRQRQKSQLNNLKAQLMTQAIERKNQLLANVSHDLRTPLTILKLNIESLQYNLESDTDQAYANVHSKIAQLNTLIHDIYQATQFDNNILALEYQKVDIYQLLAGMCDDFETLAEKSNLQLTFQNSGDASVVSIDPERCKQVIGNLLRNSISYTNEEGMIKLSIKIFPESFSIFIDDSAPGLDDEDFDKIFERLYRCEKSRNRDTGGSGLGLAICKQIMLAHGGDINAKKSDLGGVKMCITFPIIPLKT